MHIVLVTTAHSIRSLFIIHFPFSLYLILYELYS